MLVSNLNDYIKGWIVGNFDPAVIKTSDFEVGIKYYKAGDYELKHFHKEANEITVIASGKVIMNGIIYDQHSVIKIEKGEVTDFKVIEDTITVVVKIPSVKDDKYLVDQSSETKQ